MTVTQRLLLLIGSEVLGLAGVAGVIHAQGVGGSTILGSGGVALILDVPTLIRQQEHNRFPG